MKKVLFLTIIFALLLFGGKVEAQTDGTLDTSFVIGTGFNSSPVTTIIQTDGKILVGGSFSNYNGVNRNRIIRLNTDGSVDTSFSIGTGFNDTVYTIALQSDGKIVVGGNFTSYNDIAQNRIVRLNIDGSIDTSFVMGDGFSTPSGMSFIETIAIQSDGKILAGGRFAKYNGTNQQNIARLNADGSADASFYPVNGLRFDHDVNIIALQADGKILAGGGFTSIYSTSRRYLARLNTNGTLDTSFNVGTGFGGSLSGSVVRSIAVQTDGKILMGGYFTTYKGIVQNRIVRLNTTGSVDTSFAIGTGIDNFFVETIALQSDGKILLGGGFTTYNGISQNRIIRLDTSGSIDASFNIGTAFNNPVASISLQSDGKILVAGYFSSYKGLVQNQIARLNGTGTILSVTDVSKKKIALYPNPVSEILNFSEEVYNIKITDLSGKVVTQIFGSKKYVNVKNLVKGVYFITAITKSGEIVTHKIVKE
ncbi:T9SS type A sorting domain-containing protein [Chryseobacterium sp. G0201]|uniref:T9SS type A sorting domain-containing protein n=1 Tax=Chryseobacterium sp. G0201 TaxID=2487065 RepID=UPI000F4E54C7|nr:T9SS type A sorting domain-containing protein [Chryseobacterium sp. G0201]AZA53382.1 T9SS C-terminal target domain-containing protein [Chryseobacterium sp. G0201]